jgi:hypothetical protein
MPPILSKPSSAAPASLFYITSGALLSVWSGIWFVYLRNYPPSQQFIHYLCFGFLATGLVLLCIGLTLGPLARLARHAELPPAGAVPPVAQAEQPRAAATATAANTAPNRV